MVTVNGEEIEKKVKNTDFDDDDQNDIDISEDDWKKGFEEAEGLL